jgi:hypothetical protein
MRHSYANVNTKRGAAVTPQLRGSHRREQRDLRGTADGINRIITIIRSILLSGPTPGFVLAPFASLRDTFPHLFSSPRREERKAGIRLLDIAPESRIMIRAANDGAISEETVQC